MSHCLTSSFSTEAHLSADQSRRNSPAPSFSGPYPNPSFSYYPHQQPPQQHPGSLSLHGRGPNYSYYHHHQRQRKANPYAHQPPGQPNVYPPSRSSRGGGRRGSFRRPYSAPVCEGSHLELSPASTTSSSTMMNNGNNNRNGNHLNKNATLYGTPQKTTPGRIQPFSNTQSPRYTPKIIMCSPSHHAKPNNNNNNNNNSNKDFFPRSSKKKTRMINNTNAHNANAAKAANGWNAAAVSSSSFSSFLPPSKATKSSTQKLRGNKKQQQQQLWRKTSRSPHSGSPSYNTKAERISGGGISDPKSSIHVQPHLHHHHRHNSVHDNSGNNHFHTVSMGEDLRTPPRRGDTYYGSSPRDQWTAPSNRQTSLSATGVVMVAVPRGVETSSDSRGRRDRGFLGDSPLSVSTDVEATYDPVSFSGGTTSITGPASCSPPSRFDCLRDAARGAASHRSTGVSSLPATSPATVSRWSAPRRCVAEERMAVMMMKPRPHNPTNTSACASATAARGPSRTSSPIATSPTEVFPSHCSSPASSVSSSLCFFAPPSFVMPTSANGDSNAKVPSVDTRLVVGSREETNPTAAAHGCKHQSWAQQSVTSHMASSSWSTGGISCSYMSSALPLPPPPRRKLPIPFIHGISIAARVTGQDEIEEESADRRVACGSMPSSEERSDDLAATLVYRRSTSNEASRSRCPPSTNTDSRRMSSRRHHHSGGPHDDEDDEDHVEVEDDDTDADAGMWESAAAERLAPSNAFLWCCQTETEEDVEGRRSSPHHGVDGGFAVLLEPSARVVGAPTTTPVLPPSLTLAHDEDEGDIHDLTKEVEEEEEEEAPRITLTRAGSACPSMSCTLKRHSRDVGEEALQATEEEDRANHAESYRHHHHHDRRTATSGWAVHHRPRIFSSKEEIAQALAPVTAYSLPLAPATVGSSSSSSSSISPVSVTAKAKTLAPPPPPSIVTQTTDPAVSGVEPDRVPLYSQPDQQLRWLELLLLYRNRENHEGAEEDEEEQPLLVPPSSSSSLLSRPRTATTTVTATAAAAAAVPSPAPITSSLASASLFPLTLLGAGSNRGRSLSSSLDNPAMPFSIWTHRPSRPVVPSLLEAAGTTEEEVEEWQYHHTRPSTHAEEAADSDPETWRKHISTKDAIYLRVQREIQKGKTLSEKRLYAYGGEGDRSGDYLSSLNTR